MSKRPEGLPLNKRKVVIKLLSHPRVRRLAIELLKDPRVRRFILRQAARQLRRR